MSVTLSVVTDSSVYASLLLLAEAAFARSLMVRRGSEALESGTYRANQRLVGLGCGLSAAGIASLLVIAAGGLMMSTGAGGIFSARQIAVLLPSALGFLVAVHVGLLIGRFIPWPPLSAFLALVVWAAIVYSLRFTWASNLLLFRGSASPFDRVRTAFPLLQAAEMTSLLALAFLVLFGSRRWLLSATPAVAILGASAALLVGGGSGWFVPDAAAGITFCQRTTFLLCLPRAQEPLRRRLESFAAQSVEAAAVTGVRDPPVFVSRDAGTLPLTRTERETAQVVMITARHNFEVDAMIPDRNSVLVDTIPALVNPSNCPLVEFGAGSDHGVQLTSMGEVVYWVFARSDVHPQGYDLPVMQVVLRAEGDLWSRLDGMNLEARMEFFEESGAALRSCKDPVS